ncbi:MAG: VWA domain-containing protein [Muribaculaceae bacterium]|nr:VWA domain-containing protein [Muribaculaceae bacterium]
MMTFAYPSLLFLLLLVPAYLGLYVWARYARKRNLRKFGKLTSLLPLMPDVSPYKPAIKITVRLIALVCIILAVARPWGGLKDEKTDKEGIEVVIAVDASNSMLASADGSDNGTDRMRTAKLMLEKLINRLDNDRVGLIMYAGEAYTLIPVTNDYVSAKTFLNSIDPSQVTNQGTNISAAVNMALSSFSEDKHIGKAIILITDAEELEDKQAVMESAKLATRNGVQLDVIGVGSSTPSKIPMGGSFLIDPETGAPVETALNEDLAAEVAAAGKGIYVNAANKDALNELEKQLDTLKRTTLEASVYAVHEELFPIFVWIALIAICFDIFVLDRRILWLDKFTFFKKEDKKS